MPLAATLPSSPQIILDNSSISIQYHASESLIMLRWKRQISFQERKKGFLWANWFCYKHGVKNWLIDDVEVFLITQEEKDWILSAWIRLVIGAGVRKIAVVTSAELPALISLTSFTQTAQKLYAASGTTSHEVFTDYQMAITWLTEELEMSLLPEKSA